MKIASKTISIITFIVTTVALALYAILYLAGGGILLGLGEGGELPAGIMVMLAFVIVALYIPILVVFSKLMKSFRDDEKSIALGVCTIIFVSVPAGILYLCWEPYRRPHYRSHNNYSYSESEIYSNPKPATASKVLTEKEAEEEFRKLENLHNKGILNDQEYADAKRNVINRM